MYSFHILSLIDMSPSSSIVRMYPGMEELHQNMQYWEQSNSSFWHLKIQHNCQTLVIHVLLSS